MNGKQFCQPKWCGFFMIIAGLLWLGTRLNWINPDLFWPLLLMIMGSLMILPILFRNPGGGGGQKAGGPGTFGQTQR